MKTTKKTIKNLSSVGVILIPKGADSREATTMDELIQKHDYALSEYCLAKEEIKKYKEFLKSEIEKVN